jgi:hypothetical protein
MSTEPSFFPYGFTAPLHSQINKVFSVTPRQATNIINQETGDSLEYRHIIHDEATFTIWNKSAANEFSRWNQGVGGRIEGSNTILFIPRQAVPKLKIVTYGDGLWPQQKCLTDSGSMWAEA